MNISKKCPPHKVNITLIYEGSKIKVYQHRTATRQLVLASHHLFIISATHYPDGTTHHTYQILYTTPYK